MAQTQITKFEHFIREANDNKLDEFDLAVILRFNEGVHDDLTEEEEKEAIDIIKKKDVSIQLLSVTYYQKGETKHYNIYTRAVWRCLSKSQWSLLERYYRSFYKEPSKEDGDK